MFRGKKAARGGVALDANAGVIITGKVKGDVMQVGAQNLPLAELTLPWRPQPLPTIESLLSWKSRLTELVGRADERSELMDWAERSPPIAARLVHGPAGSGKTRLAGEVAEALREQDWAAGQLDPERPSAYRSGARGTLLLVDYPEEKRQTVQKLLEALGRMEEPRKPLRLLLLSRHGEAHWQAEFQAAHASEVMDVPLALRPLEAASPWALFSAGWTRACEVLNKPQTALPVTQTLFANWLSQDPLHHRPLFILAYAVQLALEPETRGLSGPKVMAWLTGRERSRWRHEAEAVGMHADALLRLKALAGTTGGLSAAQIRALAGETHIALNLPAANNVLDRVRQTGELVDGQLPPVEPDLLAANALSVVLKDATDQAGAWLWAALEGSEALDRSLARLGRLAYDMEQTLGLPWPGALLGGAVHGHPERCQALDEHLSRPYLERGLLPLAVAVSRTLAEAAEDEPTQAQHLSDLSNHLAMSGDRAGALKAIERAAAIGERLAKANPAAYELGLAMCVQNLSNRLAENGDRPGALKAIERAVVIRERLAQANPDAHEPDLAASLNNLSNHLAGSGDRAGALAAIERAVAIRERLAQANPDAYEPDLAASLNNLSNHLAGSGDRAGALAAIERAVAIRERLAQANSAAHEPDLAMSLNNLSNRLAEKGNRAGALAAIERAVAIRERLAQANPAAHEPDLAMSLNNLSLRLAKKGNRAGALVAIERAVAIRERLAQANPAAHEPDLAMSLHNLSARLAEIGDLLGALAAIERAVAIRERLAQANPAGHEPDLAMSLHNLSARLAENGNQLGALAAIERATRLIRPYAVPGTPYVGWLASMEAGVATLSSRRKG